MGVSLKITVPDLTHLVEGLGNADETVIAGWGKDAETLLQLEIYNVTKRTEERTSGPYSTGALASSVTGQAYPGSKNGTLIAVWFNNAQQYAEWGRYYAPYQEGPPLGLHTYTIGMHHMLYDSQEQDAGEITDWAVQAGQATVDEQIGL
jgi:hypothetical protein